MFVSLYVCMRAYFFLRSITLPANLFSEKTPIIARQTLAGCETGHLMTSSGWRATHSWWHPGKTKAPSTAGFCAPPCPGARPSSFCQRLAGASCTKLSLRCHREARGRKVPDTTGLLQVSYVRWHSETQTVPDSNCQKKEGIYCKKKTTNKIKKQTNKLDHFSTCDSR